MFEYITENQDVVLFAYRPPVETIEVCYEDFAHLGTSYGSRTGIPFDTIDFSSEVLRAQYVSEQPSAATYIEDSAGVGGQELPEVTAR